MEEDQRTVECVNYLGSLSTIYTSSLKLNSGPVYYDEHTPAPLTG